MHVPGTGSGLAGARERGREGGREGGGEKRERERERKNRETEPREREPHAYSISVHLRGMGDFLFCCVHILYIGPSSGVWGV